MTDLTFDCMGTDVRLLADDADECRAFLEHFDATLSRFRPDSELCRLNARPARARSRPRRCCAPRSPPACRRGAHRRARRPDARRAARGRRLRPHPPRARARRSPRRSPAAPAAQPAAPDPDEPWRQRRDHRRHASAARPACGSTPAAPARASPPTCSANRLDGRWAVDCGGDLRVGGALDVEVRHPLTTRAIHTLAPRPTAPSPPRASTRGCGARADGTPRHHLLDPRTGEPAWTGPDQRHRARAHRARGRGAGQGRAAQRPATARRRWLDRHGGLADHTTTATSQLRV